MKQWSSRSTINGTSQLFTIFPVSGACISKLVIRHGGKFRHETSIGSCRVFCSSRNVSEVNPDVNFSNSSASRRTVNRVSKM